MSWLENNMGELSTQGHSYALGSPLIYSLMSSLLGKG